jgi:hypothetical protein
MVRGNRHSVSVSLQLTAPPPPPSPLSLLDSATLPWLFTSSPSVGRSCLSGFMRQRW